MAEPKSIADLRSLGPKSQEMLARVGVGSIAQLRALGSVPAYVIAKRTNRNVSLNLLWALESALSGESWQEVARLHRTSLLLAVEEYEKNVHGNAESAVTPAQAGVQCPGFSGFRLPPE